MKKKPKSTIAKFATKHPVKTVFLGLAAISAVTRVLIAVIEAVAGQDRVNAWVEAHAIGAKRALPPSDA